MYSCIYSCFISPLRQNQDVFTNNTNDILDFEERDCISEYKSSYVLRCRSSRPLICLATPTLCFTYLWHAICECNSFASKATLNKPLATNGIKM